MSRYYTHEDERRLVLLREEHTRLSRQDVYALSELFSDETLDIVEYCQDFRPNPYAERSDATVKAFAQQYNIWVEEGGDHYNNMTAYLHPTPNFDRLTAIGMAYAVLFFMNDTIGREKLGHMTESQRAEVRQIIERLDGLIDTGMLDAAASPIEKSALASLKEIQRNSDPKWYQNFLKLMKQHLAPSFFDQNARAQGQVLTIDEYIDRRLHISGMYATVALMEFGDNQYLDWHELKQHMLAGGISRLQWLCAAIGAFMNDMFSFEKEFIVDESDFNLIPVIALNEPSLTLDEVVLKAADIVREMVKEFRDLAQLLEANSDVLSPPCADAVRAHILSLTCSVQATWVWENVTERYKQPYTIFRENLIDQPVAY